MEIVLFEPQIPQNTGNILRTCAVTGASLSLIKPLGFEVSDKQMRRSGLDYAKDVPLSLFDNWEHYLSSRRNKPLFFFSSKAHQYYTSAKYTIDTSIVFGAETHGLPEKLFQEQPENFYLIPMKENCRCLNLSTSAAIVLYEALRQLNFPL